MASSEDEPEATLQSVTNYYFEDGNSEPVPFSVLPLHADAGEKTTVSDRQVFLLGASDGGLQKVYKQVSAWRLGLEGDKPEISVLGKDGKWIDLLKPRKIYEEDTARTILVTVHLLHYLRKMPDASDKSLWAHLNKVFSFENLVSADDLRGHEGLIKQVMGNDEKLAKSQLLLIFLKERSRQSIPREDEINIPDAKKPFIAAYPDVGVGMEDDDGNDSEEEPDLFDSVCAICDNGGELLCCEGRCLRSFHATRSDGEESDCRSLGFSRSQVKAIQNFLCMNCLYKRHQCFACGKLGSSDKTAAAEVFRCVNATCGHFYHPKCVARLVYRDDKAKVSEYENKIAKGESFTCPVHKCIVCDKGENKEVKDLQFAICRRCPKSYHRKCLPREIPFEVDSDDEGEEDIIQRAWDDLLPNRILIYCTDHEIDEELGTPIRNHIKFPEVVEKKKHVDVQTSKVLVKRKIDDHGTSRDKTSMKLKRATVKLSSLEGHSLLKSGRETSAPVSERKKIKLLRDGPQSDLQKFPLDAKPSTKEKTKASVLSASTVPASKKSSNSFPAVDAETEKRMLLFMQKSSSITMEDVKRKLTVPSTHASSARYIDKAITHGKVEGSVEAIRAALKKLEDGGSVEDARAVCEPDILKQIVRWNSKFKVYLAPFLHGVRYTSFGRHFTKVDKLMEIVEKLQWYVQNGDMIVDFCCGANDFSQLMKEKLEAVGKKCLFKNFDVIQPKNDFCFEKRDWMTVQPKELPTGSQLIMGLNPPFGLKAALANKFIDKALTFKPKLIILIVPPETERLDKKSARYDLVWEDFQKLSGKSFYLPGSVDVHDKQIEQWNNTPPVLYMWSRPDWTTKHKTVAVKQGHITDGTGVSHFEGNVFQQQLDTVPVSEPNGKVHEKRGATPGVGEVRRQGNNSEQRINDRHAEKNGERPFKRRKRERNNHSTDGKNLVKTPDISMPPPDEAGKSSGTSDMSMSPLDTARHLPGVANDRRTSSEAHPLRGSAPSERASIVYPGPGTEFSVTGIEGRPTVLGEDIDGIAKRYNAPLSGEFLNSGYNSSGGDISGWDYSGRSSEEQFRSYSRDSSIQNFGRNPSMNSVEGYGRLSEAAVPLQPRSYSMQSQDGISHSSRYSLGSSSLGPSSSALGSSAMQRYAPRFEETNYPRTASLGPPASVGLLPRSSIYDMPGNTTDSLDFARGPQQGYPRPGSSGWLND